MSYTVYGRNVYAIGSNKAAARNIGVNVNEVECSVYVLIGILAALAGYLTFARSGTFQPATAATLHGITDAGSPPEAHADAGENPPAWV